MRALMLVRTIVDRRIAAGAKRRVTVLCAPAGYGKTVAIDAYLRNVKGDVLRLNVGRDDTSRAAFLRSLAAAFGHALPRIGESLATAHDRASHGIASSELLATCIARQLASVARTIVIDDLHNGDDDRDIVALLATAIERSDTSVRWMLAVRSTRDLPLARWLAAGDAALPIDEHVLRLTEEEALAIGGPLAPMLSAATVLRLRDRTNGAAASFTFGLRTLALEPSQTGAFIDSQGDAYDRFADHVFSRFTALERTRLLASVAPGRDAGPLPPRAQPWLDAIYERAPQVFRVMDGRISYTNLFYRYLCVRRNACVDEAGREVPDTLERAG